MASSRCTLARRRNRGRPSRPRNTIPRTCSRGCTRRPGGTRPHSRLVSTAEGTLEVDSVNVSFGLNFSFVAFLCYDEQMGPAFGGPDIFVFFRRMLTESWAIHPKSIFPSDSSLSNSNPPFPSGP